MGRDNEKTDDLFNIELNRVLDYYGQWNPKVNGVMDVKLITALNFRDASLFAKEYPDTFITREPNSDKFAIKPLSGKYIRIDSYITYMFTYEAEVEDFIINSPLPPDIYDFSLLPEDAWSKIGKEKFSAESIFDYFSSVFCMSQRQTIRRVPPSWSELEQLIENKGLILFPLSTEVSFILYDDAGYISIDSAFVTKGNETWFVTSGWSDDFYNYLFPRYS